MAKKIEPEHRTIKQLALGLFIGILLISAGELIPRALERYLPFDYYVDIHSITVSDVVQGDKYQSGIISRTVKSEDGYPVDVVAELMLVGVTQDGQDIKVFYNDNRQFFEQGPDDSIAFRENLPEGLEPGTYYWVYGFTLNINNHLNRSKTVKSNDFKVKALAELINENDLLVPEMATTTSIKVNVGQSEPLRVYVPLEPVLPQPSDTKETIILRETNTTNNNTETRVEETNNETVTETSQEEKGPIKNLLESIF